MCIKNNYKTENSGKMTDHLPSSDRSNEELLNELELLRLENNSLKVALNERDKECELLHSSIRERKKELEMVYRMSSVFEEKGSDLVEILQDIADMLPLSWRYPDITSAQIVIEDIVYKSQGCTESRWQLSVPVSIDNVKAGRIDIFYSQEMPIEFEGPFLEEEILLLLVVSEWISGLLKRSLSEEKLRSGETMLYKIIDTIPQAIFWKDQQGKYLGCNKEFAKAAGIDDFALITGKTDSDLPWPQESINIYLPDDNEIIQTKQPRLHVIESHRQPDGTERWLDTSKLPLTDRTGKVFGVLGIYEDITEFRKTAEILTRSQQMLMESEQKYRMIAENVSDVIWVLNLSRRKFTYFSPSIEKLLGYTPEEAIEKSLSDILLPPDMEIISKRITGIFREIRYTGSSFTFRDEFQQPCKNGTLVWVEFSSHYRENDAGEIEIFGVSRNIEERKNAEQEMIIAKEQAIESDRLKTAFLQNLSHEIRTPMNSIIGFSQLLKDPNLSGEDQLEFINMIKDGSDRMMNLINQLVDISKIEAGITEMKIVGTNLEEQLRFVYNFFKPESDKKGLELILKTSLKQHEVTINTDKDKLFAILSNLLKNAIKYTPNGFIEFGCAPRESEIIFYVKDSGIGIHAERQTAIFERFMQADIEDRQAMQGAGLGLSISKSYIEMLGGKIWVESHPGAGSTFYFSHPLQKVHHEIPAAGEDVQGKKDLKDNELKIMIVEDDYDSTLLLDRIVKKITTRIIKARSGPEALDLFNNNTDTDVILMDIRMPGMDGLEVTSRIRETNNDVIIIAQTAYAMKGDRENAIETGCNDYISKPIDPTELKTMILHHTAAR